MHLIRE